MSLFNTQPHGIIATFTIRAASPGIATLVVKGDCAAISRDDLVDLALRRVRIKQGRRISPFTTKWT